MISSACSASVNIRPVKMESFSAWGSSPSTGEGGISFSPNTREFLDDGLFGGSNSCHSGNDTSAAYGAAAHGDHLQLDQIDLSSSDVFANFDLENCLKVEQHPELQLSIQQQQQQLSTSPASCVMKDEPFSFLNDLELPTDDTLKSDCMWSSSLELLDNIHKKNRNRDNSLTLSECADSLFRDLKDIDSVLGSGPSAAMVTAAAAGLMMETSASAASISSSNADSSDVDMSDEEIDVVSDCDAGSSSSSSTISSYSTGSMSASSAIPAGLPSSSSAFFRHQQINNGPSRPSSTHALQAGRSLLRKSQQQQQKQQYRAPQYQAEPSPQTIIDHMNGDHCYFALRQEPMAIMQQAAASAQLHRPTGFDSPPGLLTPNESSDDEEVSKQEYMTSLSRRNAMMNNNNNRQNSKQQQMAQQQETQNVKFKFRMKFKSNSPQRSLLDVNNSGTGDNNNNSSNHRHHIERKSAIRNTHCPTPSPSKQMKMEEEDYEDQQDPLRLEGEPKLKSRWTSSSSPDSPTADASNESLQEYKCREIRDLHNSMERQRRGDLRNNFDQLKDVVPELRAVEKPSKLNILNKSAESCRLLCSADARLSREREREVGRRAALRKKLAMLANTFHHGGNSRHLSYL